MAANQEVLDAINATIATNGVKGISAESLRNVLTLMAENMGNGGGSGEGLLRVMIISGSKLEESWVEGVTEYEVTPEFINSFPEYADIADEFFSHNASVYTQLMEKVQADESAMVLLDSSIMTKIDTNTIYEAIVGIPNAFSHTVITQPATVMFISSDVPDIEANNNTGLFLVPFSTDTLSQNIQEIQLREDGSLLFRFMSTDTDTETTE